MPRFAKPAEGTWTEHYPELGTEPVAYDDSISPEFYELEREAIFKRAWLNVGRVEQLPKTGSYFTKELAGRQRVDHPRARPRRRRPRVSQHLPPPRQQARVERRPARGDRRALPAVRVQVPRLALRPRRQHSTSCSRKSEFFDLDKSCHGLVPVHCDVWAGFIFVNLAKEPEQSLREFLGPMVTALDGYPFDRMTERFALSHRGARELEAVHGRVRGVLPRTRPAREAVARALRGRRSEARLRSAALPHRRSTSAREHLGRAQLGDGRRRGQAVPRC